MKQITIVLLITLSLSCTAQDGDINCYSIDSVNQIKADLTDSLVNHYGTVINSNMSAYKAREDSIINNYEDRIAFLSNQFIAGFSHISDTFRFEINGLTDSTTTVVEKINSDIKVIIRDGDKRIKTNYIDGFRETLYHNYITDSSYYMGTMYLNSTSTDGFAVIKLDLNRITP